MVTTWWGSPDLYASGWKCYWKETGSGDQQRDSVVWRQLPQRLLTILLISVAKVTPLLCFSCEPLLLPPREFLRITPWRVVGLVTIIYKKKKKIKTSFQLPCNGMISKRCRLFLRDEGNPFPLERRRWRLDSMAAGETSPGGGTLPILSYSSSISFFWAACRAWTSDRCLLIHHLMWIVSFYKTFLFI